MKGLKKQKKADITAEKKKQLSKEVRTFRVKDFYSVDEVFARKCDTNAFIADFKQQYC